MNLVTGVRLGAAQRGLAGGFPHWDEPRAAGGRHRDVFGRHGRLLLLRQEELAQQVTFVARKQFELPATKRFSA